MEKRKNILIVILIAISVISIWININLSMKLEQSFKENEKYLIEQFLDISYEMSEIKELLEEKQDNITQKDLEDISKRLFDNCYPRTNQIHEICQLNQEYSNLDLYSFQNFMTDMVCLPEKMNKDEIMEKSNDLLNVCNLWEKCNSSVNVEKLTEIVEAVQGFCDEFDNEFAVH